MIYIITAKIKSVNLQNAKTGSEGINIVCEHDDGSEWGKKIYGWCWWGGEQVDNTLLKWAGLVKDKPTIDEMRAIIMSHQLCGLVIEMQVDQGEKFWRIMDFGKAGTIKPVEVPDDIPF
jgi:hypothetical protein